MLSKNKGEFMPSDAEITNYDKIAELFITHAGRIDSWNNIYERPNTIARLGELKGKDVLDLGCSTGFFTEYVLGQGVKSVTAVDASKKLIEKLVGRIKDKRLTTYCADIGRPMPFLKSNFFDVIICSLVIDYVKEWAPMFEEFYRVVKKGGRVVVATSHPFAQYLYMKRRNLPQSYFAFEMFEDEWGRRGPKPFKTHYYIRPLNEVLRPIIQSRFKIISIDEPLPDERCKEIAPDEYQRLLERPGFLFIVLEK
jgi:ubiquinone/menaquinone biosynthesis C-methylase UbiE